MSAVLLDTCVLIWIGQNAPIATPPLNQIEAARTANGVLVSAVSAWEIGLAATRKRDRLTFLPEVSTWLGRLLAIPGVRVVALDYDIALAATTLPDWEHRDPADRFLVATSRALNAPIVTSDAKILAYAAAGHVRAIAC